MKKEKILEIFKNHFKSEGLKVEFRNKNKLKWNEALDKMSYVPCNYLFYSLEYEYEYQTLFNDECIDCSIIIKKYDDVFIVWPILITKKARKYQLITYDNTIYSPLVSKLLSLKNKKEVNNLCYDLVKKISNKLKIKTIRIIDSFKNEIDISIWHQNIIRNNPLLNVKYDLMLNLIDDLKSIKRNFRKSSKSLINKGFKIWNVKVMESLDKSKWEEFINLHFKVSGKKTRSNKTWDILKKQIQAKEAFLVYLEDDKNKIVGGGFFNFSKYECSYRVGVYSRNLFDKPLGHTVQAKAIEIMKKKLIIWYNIGPDYFEFYNPKPNEKEISISYFKKGFSSHIVPKYEFIIKFK